jgi:hypothetical protein
VKADRNSFLRTEVETEEILAHFHIKLVGLLLAVALGYAAYRIVWVTPFTINTLANRQTIEFLIANPELCSRVGIADGTIFDWHSGKLAPGGVTQRDAIYRQAETSLSELRRFNGHFSHSRLCLPSTQMGGGL